MFPRHYDSSRRHGAAKCQAVCYRSSSALAVKTPMATCPAKSIAENPSHISRLTPFVWSKDPWGETALHMAARASGLERIEQAWDCGIRSNGLGHKVCLA